MSHPRIFFIYLALLSMLGFLATDMYLPAFTEMQAGLHTSASLISASLSLFLAGFCCAQLFWGPMSDRIGRKTVLICGLSLFTLSSLAMVWVQDAKILLVLRFLQATGVCAATVCWQALVIDYYPKSQADKTFASIMPLVALSPALAPLLGSWLVTHFEWQAIFVVLTLISAVLLLLTMVLLQKRPVATAATPSTSISFWQILKKPAYAGNILIYAACSASFFSWLTGSPFILAKLGLTPTDIGLSYVPQTIAFLIGGFGYRALLNKFSGDQVLPWLLALYAVSLITLTLNAIVFTPSLVNLLIPFSLSALANGAIYPIVVAKALKCFPEQSGKAASLQNFSQLGLCFLFSLFVSSHIDQALSMTVIAMIFTVVIALAGFFWQRRSK